MHNLDAPAFGQATLTNCDREPIRTPGSIQAHGVLLALDPATFAIVQIAGDVEAMTGRSAKSLLGEPLSACLHESTVLRVRALVRKEQVLPRAYLIVEAEVGGRPVDICAHLSGGLVVLDLEPRRALSSFDAVEMVQSMTARVEATDSMASLLDVIAKDVQHVTGFDRVMVYRFAEDASGHVVAEQRSSNDIDSFFDLHYPAGDVPVQARELYCSSWIRSIPDIAYESAPLSPAENPLTGAPLDLSYSALRSVSPLHLEYLTNMGVAASMSLSLVIGGRLWGLVACHHYETRHLSPRLRSALELFAQLASLQIRSRLDSDRAMERALARESHARVLKRMRTGGYDDILQAGPELLRLVRAAGVVVCVDGVSASFGTTPSGAQLDDLTAWLEDSLHQGVLATRCLSHDYAAARDFRETGAGLLALATSRSPRDFMLWFLPEHASTVTWGGDPEKPIVAGPHGDRLTPRQSFAAWTQTVEHCSRPWTETEIESATDLRTTILDVVLRNVDALAKERERAKRHQDLLMAELDHRVKNTLATIQALVRFSGRSAVDLESYTRSLERRIGSMAKAHDLLTLGRWESASLRALVSDELASHRPRGHASVEIDGPDIYLDAKATVAVGLVLHELATNAVKHGCLSVDGGVVRVEWSRRLDGGAERLAILWTERCGPTVSPPSRTGFGRTLLDRVFAQDVEGSASLEFRTDGLRCVLEIPASRIVDAAATPPSRPAASLDPTIDQSNALRGLRILVVEDGVLVGLELAETLSSFGATVLGPCCDIDDALDLVKNAAFDVALLDVDLNGQPIWPVAESLHARGTPFVFSTGFSDTALWPTAMQMTPTVAKPYSTRSVVEAIRAASTEPSKLS